MKAELDHLVSLGVLTPADEPTPWVSQLVITMKKSGALRVCIDLITTDCHSSFFEIDQLTDMSAETVIRKLKKNFARPGIPEELVTDCGTQYTAESFKKFANKWGFHHVTSSPGNHRANGAAEAAVKTAKRLFKRCKAAGEDPLLGLLNLRNTPTEGTDR